LPSKPQEKESEQQPKLQIDGKSDTKSQICTVQQDAGIHFHELLSEKYDRRQQGNALIACFCVTSKIHGHEPKVYVTCFL
jgi:hypothetical protein